MRIFISIAFCLVLFSCSQSETGEERIKREINENMQKLDRKLEEGNKIVDEKTKEAEEKFKELMSKDSI